MTASSKSIKESESRLTKKARSSLAPHTGKTWTIFASNPLASPKPLAPD
jgi:hypothetical protein